MAANKKTYSILAEFSSSGELLQAAGKVTQAGYTRFDCHSPFPIHGMDAAMALKRSPVGFIAGICGLAGGLFGLWLQWWTSTIDYPLVISGKPFFSYQAFVIVVFGLTILGAAFGAVFGMLIINRLPRFFHGNFYSSSFARFSDDAFFVCIEAEDPKFNTRTTSAFLESIGGSNVEVIVGE